MADFHKLEVMMINRNEFENWEAKKLKVVAQFKAFTDDQEIIIDERRDKDTDRVIRYGKGKSRMDQLEVRTSKSSSRGAQLISAQEFTNQLERLNRELKKFWEKEDKVACFRIAIQCAKLLNDVATPIFYPQKFILLTDILDNFGTLVLGRMRKLTKQYSGGKIVIDDDTPEDFDYSLIPDKVQEKCMNWFLKSACIREVLPRIYLELALVSCHRFMQRRVQQSDLLRLSKMVRGIAEPICACYTAAYLARVGFSYHPDDKDYLIVLVDFLFKIMEKAV